MCVGVVSILILGGAAQIPAAAVDAANSGEAASSDVSTPGFKPMTPTRVVDTRNNPGGQRHPSNTTLTVGLGGYVTLLTSAVVANITVTQAESAGWLTAWPCDAAMPTVSNLNFVAGQTVANLISVRLSPTGTLCLNAVANVHILVDLAGIYEFGGSARISTVTPKRILDTRQPLGVPVRGPVAALGTVRVGVASPSAPHAAADTVAATLNVTVAGSTVGGYVTVYRCDVARPVVSNLNFEAGQTVANLVTVALSGRGEICIFSSASTHLIADLSAVASPSSASGYVAVVPNRLVDTRQSAGPTARQKLAARTRLRVQVAGLASVPPDADAVVMNVTAVDPSGAGWLTVYPCGSSVPTTSNLNFAAGSTVPNLVTVSLDATGGVCFDSSTATYIVADVAGYLTGTDTVVAAGDMSCRAGDVVMPTACHARQVSNLAVSDPAASALLALGDLQYDNGELASFQSEYHTTFGRLKARTRPAPGNHEYNTPGATGYYDYFGSLAGDRTKGYYSYNIGKDWHAVVLNSNCAAVPCAPGSVQDSWLAADLAANAATGRQCLLAYWHHPLVSSGSSHGNNPATQPLMNRLTAVGVDIVLAGHEHNYERFDRPTVGPRMFVVGTGGRNLYPFAAAKPGSALRVANAFGLLKLSLRSTGYSWNFISDTGASLDTGTDVCQT